MSNNIHLKKQKRKERVALQKKQSKLQKQLEIEQKNIELKKQIFSNKNFDLVSEDIPPSILKALKSNNSQKIKKGLKQLKKETCKQFQMQIKETETEIGKLDAKIEILNELIKDSEKAPSNEIIINVAKDLICNKKQVFQTIKPIISELKSIGYITENIDIAEILLTSNQFHRGAFSKVWLYKKPPIVYFYFRKKYILLRNTVKYTLQKYLPKLYKLPNRF